MLTPIRYDRDRRTLLLLDQKALPLVERFEECATCAQAADRIRDLTVRGAPAIGVAAAWGAVLAAENARDLPTDADWRSFVDQALSDLENARPTAVNLAWAVQRMRRVMRETDPPAAADLAAIWGREAARMQDEDVAVNRAMGRYGAQLIEDGDRVLTHCNAGALATAGYGTALGVLRAAVEQGKRISVIANETRPVLQGARLTAYELHRDGIPVRVAPDGAAGTLMRQGLVDKVIVGADRIAANGDVANKIGTYTMAVLAREHGIPFYVAAPFSTIDMETGSGEGIAIEERGTEEVARLGGARVMPEGVEAYNFAFDVTPAELVTRLITERGVLQAPYADSIKNAVQTPL